MKDSYVFFYFTVMPSLLSQKILHRAVFQIYWALPATVGSVTEVSVAMLFDVFKSTYLLVMRSQRTCGSRNACAKKKMVGRRHDDEADTVEGVLAVLRTL